MNTHVRVDVKCAKCGEFHSAILDRATGALYGECRFCGHVTDRKGR